jgi:hypothetical protein
MTIPQVFMIKTMLFSAIPRKLPGNLQTIPGDRNK